MNNMIIDFLKIKRQRQDRQTVQKFQGVNSQMNMDAFLNGQEIQLKDRQLFLAFLAYADAIQLNPQQLFVDAIRLSRYQFQHKYQMDWEASIQLTRTFLLIIQTSEPQQYKEFLNKINYSKY